MISFEWLELETLSRDIADLENQISAAKASKNHGRLGWLEPQLEATRERRARALEAVTNRAASAAAEAAHRSHKARRAPQPLIEDLSIAQWSNSKSTDAVKNTLSTIAGPTGAKGDIVMWDRLTPDDLDRAKRELASRHIDMLARQAEELHDLDAEQQKVDELGHAIEAFARKFSNRANDLVGVQRSADAALLTG